MSTVVFGGKECRSPIPALDACRRLGLPTESWYGRANGFRCPLGMEPGTGLLLMRASDAADLDTGLLYDLTFRLTAEEVVPSFGAKQVTLKNLFLVRTEALSPGLRNDDDDFLILHVTDKRHLCRDTAVDRGFNIRNVPLGEYYASTINGVSPWTWDEVGSALWSAVGSRLGAWPGLPFNPDGVPEDMDFWGANAYTALNHFLGRIECALKLNPLTDTFSIVRMGIDDAAYDAALGKWDHIRVWDGYDVEATRGRIPAQIRVRFRKLPPPEGASPWYMIDVSDVAYDGAPVETGTKYLLDDDLPALYDALGNPENLVELTSRASERAADYYKKLRGLDYRLHRTYALPLDDAGFLPGSRIRSTWWGDVGKGLVTVIERHPDRPPLGSVPPSACCEEPYAMVNSSVNTYDTTLYNLTVSNDMTFEGDVTYISGSTATFASGSTIVLAGPTINMTASTTLTVSAGQTFTIAGGAGAKLDITIPILDLDSPLIKYSTTAVTWELPASTTITTTGSNVSSPTITLVTTAGGLLNTVNIGTTGTPVPTLTVYVNTVTVGGTPTFNLTTNTTFTITTSTTHTTTGTDQTNSPKIIITTDGSTPSKITSVTIGNTTNPIPTYTLTGTNLTFNLPASPGTFTIQTTSGPTAIATFTNPTSGPLTFTIGLTVATTLGRYLQYPYPSAQTLNTNQNDYTPPTWGMVIPLNITANIDLTGLAPPITVSAGVKLMTTLLNTGTNAVTLKNESASSTAANRFTLPSATDYAIPPGGSQPLLYDPVNSRWYLASPPMSTGGGGSSSGTSGEVQQADGSGGFTDDGGTQATIKIGGNVMFYVDSSNNCKIGIGGGTQGFFGVTGSTIQSLGSAASDLASVITLANSIRTALQAYNLCS